MELIQNLYASIGVGRYERAEAIIRRLQMLYVSTAPELTEAHTIYIRALVDALSIGRQNVNLKRIQQWFEVEIRRAGVPINPNILALMCRASFMGLDGAPRVRTIRRYLHAAEQVGVLDATMASGEYLPAEWSELVGIRDDLYSPPSDLEISDASLEGQQTTPPHPAAHTQANPLPQVRSVPQKGLGLETLRKSLLSLERADQVPYPDESEGTPEERLYKWNLRRQRRLEEDVCEAALEQWRSEHAHMLKMGINTGLKTKSMDAMLFEWHTALRKEIDKQLAEIKKTLSKWDATKPNPQGERRGPKVLELLYIGPYLESLKSEKIAALTLMTTMTTLIPERGLGPSVDGLNVSRLVSTIGASLEAEFTSRNEPGSRRSHKLRVQLSQHRKQMMHRSRNAALSEKDVKSSQTPEAVSGVTQSSIEAIREGQFEWPQQVKIQIGAWLLAKLIDVAKIQVEPQAGATETTMEPAFRHSQVTRKGKTIGVAIPHVALLTKLRREPAASAIAAKLPMLVPPIPWTGVKEGGYLQQITPVVRIAHDTTQAAYTKAAAEKGDLDQIFAGLDVLGRTGWSINRDVLKVMLDAWNSGEVIAAIPPEDPELSYPPEPDSSADKVEKRRWHMERERIDNEKAGYHSQRCFYNLQLELARAFANEVFYFPHSIDFRGRAYAVPPYLSHMCADNARGLLTFAQGKELGEEGLKWLKVQLANVFGYDKASLKDREQFAVDSLDEIRDSATKPLEGRRWWLKAEDPWQCLAACFELNAAFDLPDPTTFVSRLAVHQDGTCNGLQHYAALGGDTFGASQVNLEPGDRPADIYTGVAELVKASINKDVETGNPMAKVLQGKITRKVVKQTVMTNVYGVTFIGARAQVQRQLDDIMRNMSECDIDNFHLSSYIAKKIFEALATMFEGAQGIQKWLGECANRISTTITPEQVAKFHEAAEMERDPKYQPEMIKKILDNVKLQAKHKPAPDFRSAVIWTTPLKLPVVQPYRGRKYKDIRTALQIISIANPDGSVAVAKRKQLQAFPPNFIHSLDATHMLLSALKCDEAGLDFAAVHDSFWTHASDVPAMNSILRDAFIRMHSEDIIGRLAAEFNARYKGSLYLATVCVRSAVGKEIRQLRLATAKRRKAGDGTQKIISSKSSLQSKLLEEMIAEWERQKMLNSEDADIRKQGEDLVTPTSLLLAAQPEDLLISETSTVEPTLGVISDDGTTPASAETKASIRTASDDYAEGEEYDDDDIDDDGEPFVQESPLLPGLLAAEPAGRRKRGPNKKTSEKKIKVWLPLTFPEVPRKGDWDIARLRDSTYFFS